MAERYGLLVVILLGEIVINFLDDFSLKKPSQAAIDTLLSFLMSVCFYYLYFRAEYSNHDKHALRRQYYIGIIWGCMIS
jgi:low temperature requirement protein LtrA